jgi:MoxR-like ATPase
MKDFITINGKKVLAGRPYVPDANYIPDLIGREGELKMLLAAWMGNRHHPPLAPLLVGEPGVGKNRIVYEAARLAGKDLYIFQGHEDVTAEDLACAVRFSDDPGQKMDYVLSPLVTAMKQGAICFIDEIGKIRPRALALLVSVLDERRYIDSILLGERITASEGFRFIAATNSADMAANAMPDFIRSRMRPVIQVGYPCREEINRIIARQFPDIQDYLNGLLHGFWELWTDLPGKTPPSPRDAIYIFSHAINLAEYEAVEAQRASMPEPAAPLPLDARRHLPAVTPEHLKTVFENFSQVFERRTL